MLLARGLGALAVTSLPNIRYLTNFDGSSAIVVLTDGDDTDSRMTLEQLLPSIRFDIERHTIRVFTIAYGKDARKDRNRAPISPGSGVP